jgi:hypothetical protein
VIPTPLSEAMPELVRLVAGDIGELRSEEINE